MMLYFNRLPGLGKEDVEILLNELEEKGYINDQRYVLDLSLIHIYLPVLFICY